ncbi:MAG: hypothetical protein A2V86_09415 [Deltaproteobacteria bacterium RBG_16_49_23]|nr:MAG: hypothetical protein A2V86_09415 [Deltaproteobacteria bacterium RBG_16_49_23]
MVEDKRCPLFRKPESLGMGGGIGYCDMDSGGTTCEGDMKFCERPDALKKYLRIKMNDLEEKEK